MHFCSRYCDLLKCPYLDSVRKRGDFFIYTRRRYPTQYFSIVKSFPVGAALTYVELGDAALDFWCFLFKICSLSLYLYFCLSPLSLCFYLTFLVISVARRVGRRSSNVAFEADVP